jgi:alkaline phosphatase D
METTALNSDATQRQVELSRIAFGSCHSRGAFNKRLSTANSGTNGLSANSTIWDAITSTVQPQAFLWTGDAIYPPMKIKGDTPINVMHEEYNQMLYNSMLGYATFVNDTNLIGGVHGIWDDHDYGGNDRGRELKQREERRDEYLDFLGVPKSDARRHRHGLYSSIEFGSDIENDANTGKTLRNKIKVIFLDTRWHREKHCIPSVGSSRYIPFGAIIACTTRWFTAGFDLPSHLPPSICPSQKENTVLGEEQWMWLEKQLTDSSASVHIIVSSIQVLTTNPVVESWGHFPAERSKLLKLLNVVPGVMILSGDVHHAEISTTSNQHIKRIHHGTIVEVTSSGLTHSCSGPRIYGPLCEPILNLFSAHRFEGGNIKDVSAPSYYTGLNFGSINFDWDSRSFEVQVHNEYGDVILSTGSLQMDTSADMTPKQLESVAKCIDGHFISAAKRMNFPESMAIVMLFVCLYFYFVKPSLSRRQHYKED